MNAQELIYQAEDSIRNQESLLAHFYPNIYQSIKADQNLSLVGRGLVGR